MLDAAMGHLRQAHCARLWLHAVAILQDLGSDTGEESEQRSNNIRSSFSYHHIHDEHVKASTQAIPSSRVISSSRGVGYELQGEGRERAGLSDWEGVRWLGNTWQLMTPTVGTPKDWGGVMKSVVSDP
jgi:hypothetical protein